mmetsp:Transcript_24349/g.24959  ORF Transcript_24349/g.24959 Transcript_24349/m.24959 type:complete len:207 (-) Transcript_24349:377-997(-)
MKFNLHHYHLLIQQQQQQPLYSNVAPSIPQSNDLLADIFAPAPSSSIPLQTPIIPQTIPSNVFTPQPATNFTPTPAPILPLVTPPVNPTFKAFEKNGLVVFFELSKPNPANPSGTVILCKFSNTNNSPISNLVFQAAVPKFLKLEMLPPTGTVIPPNSQGAVTQEIRVTNSMQGEKSIMLKLKVGFSVNGQTVEELTQVSSFPPLY